ncbi:YfhO family protein [Lactobacillus psittaci]|uniref:Bacterial membrane protein YfhO n=1 Tax=Lactobacillus psittaci DSM 15354 TaxID=1122152 RepID=A0A0R1S8Y7_9LACO|nr:YfhO family protein [Lactobacillus psittaci]KRL63274.1 hypothetical protein FC23_GL000843 [Lactobacillus psittaci DSM 15354]
MKKIPKFVIPVTISAIIFLLAGLLTGTNPYFGGTLNSGDILDQYLSFFQYLHHILLGNLSDFSYSFANGLGGSMAGNWGYYLLSPLNFVVLLFPAAKVNLAIYTIILLKIMIASGSFYFFAKSIKKVPESWAMGLGVAYSLSAYVLSYFGNLMWLDAIAFLPFIVYGLLKIIKGNFSILYVIFLAITIVANYYTAYMVCVFLGAFFIYQAFLEFTNWKAFWKSARLFIISSFTAGLISCIASVPTFFNLLENKLNYHLLVTPIQTKLLLSVLPANFLFAGNRLLIPLVYIGTLATLFLIAFFFNSSIALKQRIASAVFLLFLFSGLFSTKIYLLWHGGQPPQFYPFRYAFIIVFTIAYLATISATTIQISKKRDSYIYNACFAVLILIYLLVSRKLLVIETNTVIATIVVFILAVILFNLYLHKLIKPKWLALFIILDIFANTYYSYSKISKNVTPYNPYTEQTAALLSKLPSSAKNQRLDKSFLINNDRSDSYLLNYHGVSVFTSNNSIQISALGGLLGLPSRGYYTFYSTGTQLTDAFYGLKTFIKTNRPSDFKGFYNYGLRNDLIGSKIWYQDKENTAYQTQGFPLAFAGYRVNNLNLKENEPLSNQAKILNALTKNHYTYFSKAISAQETSDNMTLSHEKKQLILKQIKPQKSVVTFSYKAKPNTSGYILMDPSLMSWADYNDKLSAVDKITLNGQAFRTTPVSLQPIGVHVPANGKVVLKLYFRENITQKSIIDPKLYLLNQKALAQVIKIAKARRMRINIWRGNLVSGNVKIKDGQALITTFPYTKGWSATANGKPVKIKKVLNSFIALDLPAGNYKIVLRNEMPGFKLGIAISLIGIILLAIEVYFFKKRKS